jgi:hypothetical protein
MPSTDTKPELTAKASMAQPVSQPTVYANGLNCVCILLLQAYLDDIRQTADSMFDKYFSKEGKTFAVLFK